MVNPFFDSDYSFDKENDLGLLLGEIFSFTSGGFGVIVKLPTETAPYPGYICRRHTKEEAEEIREQVLNDQTH